MTLTEARVKELFKDVLIELIEEKRDLFCEVLLEAIEEVGLANAMREGREDEYVSEDRVRAILREQL